MPKKSHKEVHVKNLPALDVVAPALQVFTILKGALPSEIAQHVLETAEELAPIYDALHGSGSAEDNCLASLRKDAALLVRATSFEQVRAVAPRLLWSFSLLRYGIMETSQRLAKVMEGWDAIMEPMEESFGLVEGTVYTSAAEYVQRQDALRAQREQSK